MVRFPELVAAEIVPVHPELFPAPILGAKDNKTRPASQIKEFLVFLFFDDTEPIAFHTSFSIPIMQEKVEYALQEISHISSTR